MKFALLIPTLNEIEGMKVICPRIKREWVDEIIVVDGGSTDGTQAYALSQGYHLIQEDKGPETGRGCTNSYRQALKHITSDVVITFSPDGNSVPEEIPPLVAKMREGYDMVIVSRYLNGAKSEDDTRETTFGNWMLTKLINILYGSNYTDALVMYRAWKTDLLRKWTNPIPKVPPMAGYEPFLSVRCAKAKLKIGEIPGDEPKRIGSTTRRFNIFKHGFAILSVILRERF